MLPLVNEYVINAKIAGGLKQGALVFLSTGKVNGFDS